MEESPKPNLSLPQLFKKYWRKALFLLAWAALMLFLRFNQERYYFHDEIEHFRDIVNAFFLIAETIFLCFITVGIARQELAWENKILNWLGAVFYLGALFLFTHGEISDVGLYLNRQAGSAGDKQYIVVTRLAGDTSGESPVLYVPGKKKLCCFDSEASLNERLCVAKKAQAGRYSCRGI